MLHYFIFGRNQRDPCLDKIRQTIGRAECSETEGAQCVQEIIRHPRLQDLTFLFIKTLSLKDLQHLSVL